MKEFTNVAGGVTSFAGGVNLFCPSWISWPGAWFERFWDILWHHFHPERVVSFKKKGRKPKANIFKFRFLVKFWINLKWCSNNLLSDCFVWIWKQVSPDFILLMDFSFLEKSTYGFLRLNSTFNPFANWDGLYPRRNQHQDLWSKLSDLDFPRAPQALFWRMY